MGFYVDDDGSTGWMDESSDDAAQRDWSAYIPNSDADYSGHEWVNSFTPANLDYGSPVGAGWGVKDTPEDNGFLAMLSALVNSGANALGKNSPLTNTLGAITTNPYFAALLSAYGANAQNKQTAGAEAANRSRFDSTLAPLQARNTQYNSPLRLAEPRMSITPVKRTGESEWFSNNRVPAFACGGLAATRLVKGGGSGQDDNVRAALSPGEYVVDADIVSALGDGNNEAGAQKLDKMRVNIRGHKRSASNNSIPPKAKPINSYLKG